MGGEAVTIIAMRTENQPGIGARAYRFYRALKLDPALCLDLAKKSNLEKKLVSATSLECPYLTSAEVTVKVEYFDGSEEVLCKYNRDEFKCDIKKNDPCNYQKTSEK